MNIWSKMITALRGGVNEAGEAIIDAQALRILDQEIRDASEELNKSKDGLASLIAQQKLSEEKVTSLKADIKKNEGFILAALEKKDEAQFDSHRRASDQAVKATNRNGESNRSSTTRATGRGSTA